MPLYLTGNPYQGVNAHFNSYLQAQQQGWLTFHNNHITYLTSEINRALPDGYYAVSELSLQIQNRYEDEAFPLRPDISFLKPSAPSGLGLATPVFEKATLEIASPSEELSAIEIYALRHTQKADLVLRLELLSPTNKRSPQPYLQVRHRFLRLGVHCVEVDYLHEQPPLFEELPRYPQTDGYPYWIVVSDATPPQGLTRFYGISVDEALPRLTLPLRDGMAVEVDFNAAYQRQFAEDRRAHTVLNYAETPENFHTYNPTDQARIQEVMAKIQANPN